MTFNIQDDFAADAGELLLVPFSSRQEGPLSEYGITRKIFGRKNNGKGRYNFFVSFL